MNFRYKLMRFMSGRYGVDTLFYVLFCVAAVLSVVNCFLRIIYIQIAVYLLMIYAIFRMMSRNIYARQKENRFFKNTARNIKSKNDTARARRADFTHIYKDCPYCRATLRLPRRKGKHRTVCPKCGKEFTVRVFKEYKPF